MIAVYVDDVVMAGESENIKTFKEQFRKIYKITDLGKVKRHLGVQYEWIKDDEESMVKINMDNMARKIVKEYEKVTNGMVKEWNLPGYPSIKHMKPENKTIQINGREGNVPSQQIEPNMFKRSQRISKTF